MGAALEVSAVIFYEEAKKMLEKKDLLEFVSNISKTEVLVGDDKEILAKTTFLKAKGFVSFNQHRRALESIEDALKHNTGAEAFKLKKYKGVVLGYLGELKQAIRILKDLLGETNDKYLLVGVYINIAWANLLLETSTEDSLEEAKKYLDMVWNDFEETDRVKKIKYYNNYSTYYSFKGDYEKAIEMQEKAEEFCEEIDLPEIYNNLAALHLDADKEGIPILVKEYTEKAEVIGNQYGNKLEMAKSFYNSAMVELREEAFLRAIDGLYLAFDYFKDAEAYPYAFDTLIKINEIVSDYKIGCLKSMKDSLKTKLKGTPYYEKI
ncbi:MAG: hypothetical protein KAX49_02490 [Halanaerobiales bacterium]|nr:hypothetical protein [Halanaerobiales bacterium]